MLPKSGKNKNNSGVCSKLAPGIHAIVASDSKCESGIIDMVLFYWPIEGTIINVDRDNPTSLFLRILHEISSTVCIPVTIKEVDDFGTEKMCENDKSDGIAINVRRVTDATNDISWEDVEKTSPNLALTKENVEFGNFQNKYNNSYYDGIDSNLTPYEIVALNGDNNTTRLCLKYQVGKRVVSQYDRMEFVNQNAAIEYFQKISQTHHIVWDEEKFNFEQLHVLVSVFDVSLKQVTQLKFEFDCCDC